MVVALWGRGQLAEDSGVEDGGGWGGVTLAYNTRSPEEVDAVIEEARAAGARIAREGAATFWGGYSGVFVDPDGHPWEVAHNPHWTIADDGSVQPRLATAPLTESRCIVRRGVDSSVRLARCSRRSPRAGGVAPRPGVRALCPDRCRIGA